MILNWILALVSAALLVLLFPNYSLWWLAPVALTPLLMACAREDRWRWRLAIGYAAGIAYWWGSCHWIAWTLAHHAGVSGVTAWMLFALFCLAKAAQMGAFAVLAGPLMRRAWAAPCVAGLWVAIEWTHAYTGFEWLNLGNAASDMSLLLRLAPWTGVWGLSFVFALMSGVIAAVLLRTQRLASLWLVALPGLFLLPDIPRVERGDREAIAVQPNIDDDTVWSEGMLARTEQQLTAMSLSPMLTKGHAIDLIVWPEMPAPFYDYDPQFTSMVSVVAGTARAGVLTGVVGRAADGMPLNSALLVGPDTMRISRYDKVNLVPFGEFVPWPFGLVTQKVSTEAGDFEAGRSVVVSKLGDHQIGTFICYESVFPSYIRRFAANGAEALFNISNDSWFGKSQARYQHLQIVRMRAVENRRWIIRATDNGVTAAIDPAGRVRQIAPEYQEAALRMGYRYESAQTLYTRFGDWFVALCALVATAGVAVSFSER